MLRRIWPKVTIETLFLRFVIIAVGAIALTLCVMSMPIALDAERAGEYRPILVGLYLTTVPFIFALYQSMKLLNYVDSKTFFTENSKMALSNIKYCALVITAIYIACMPVIYAIADSDDAPGVVGLALIITGSSLVVAAVAAVADKLIDYSAARSSQHKK